MGTLTKKLHILKTGGTEETCDIYTTTKEVGGSPYLALEVDGTKGYVKLGSTTDANATNLRVEKNGTTYAAWKKATVDVPTGMFTCTNEYNTITVPNGVTVLKVEIKGYNKFCTVGVTPGKTYSDLSGTEEIWDDGNTWSATVGRVDDRYYYLWAEVGEEGVDPLETFHIDFTLKYSPQINTLKPDYTDY
jgi:hypothetical protein